MGLAGDDGVIDPQAQPDEGRRDDGSFDPGLETGYLRRAPREHELSPELGAAPFDPGPGAGYDERRARERELKLRETRGKVQRVDASQASQAAALQPTGESEAVPADPAPVPPV